MIAVEALRMFDMSAVVGVVTCDVRLASATAVSVTLRSHQRAALTER